MGHDPNLGHWVFCLGYEPISKIFIYIYIIIYIIRLWNIFKLRIIKKWSRRKKVGNHCSIVRYT